MAKKAVANIRTVRAFASEDQELERYSLAMEAASSLNTKLGFHIGAFQGETPYACVDCHDSHQLTFPKRHDKYIDWMYDFGDSVLRWEVSGEWGYDGRPAYDIHGGFCSERLCL